MKNLEFRRKLPLYKTFHLVIAQIKEFDCIHMLVHVYITMKKNKLDKIYKSHIAINLIF